MNEHLEDEKWYKWYDWYEWYERHTVGMVRIKNVAAKTIAFPFNLKYVRQERVYVQLQNPSLNRKRLPVCIK